jgi:hypothetical protein
MFQVASNFNCLEQSHAGVNPASGRFLTKLMSDRTQGPAASSGAGVGAITRCHAAFGPDEGQTLRRQVALLGHAALAPHFPVTGGKLFEKAAAVPPWPPADCDLTALTNTVAVGLHCGVPAGFVRVAAARSAGGPPASVCGVVDGRPAVIDQVFVAAMNMRAGGVYGIPRATALSKMRFLLRAAYHGTYAAAAARGATKLVLTLVGGGVFGNPLPDVAAAAAEAHAAWIERCPCLTTAVVLPLFDAAVNVKVISDAYAAHGIRTKVVMHNGEAGKYRVH